MYVVLARHYDDAKTHVVFACTTRDAAERHLAQQAETLKGYFRRTFTLDGRFICLGHDTEGDFYATQLWIERRKMMPRHRGFTRIEEDHAQSDR